MSVWFKSRLNPWYIWIPSNPNLYSTKIIMKMRWQTIASNVSIRTISPTATPLPKAYDCVAVYIAGRRTSLVVYGWWPQPPTNKPIWLHTQALATQKPGAHCPASRTTLVATRFRVAVICPIIQVPHCIRVFFYFVWFVFINHIFQFYYELCTYCNILDIYLS